MNYFNKVKEYLKDPKKKSLTLLGIYIVFFIFVFAITSGSSEPQSIKSFEEKEEISFLDNYKEMKGYEYKIQFIEDTITRSMEGTYYKDTTLFNYNGLRYFYENEISNVLHIGDVVDGDYGEKRKSQIYTRFMHGAKEQSDYVIEMYPNVSGITTRFIQGSHDETHKINGGVVLGEIIDNARSDMIYEGQDKADVVINGVKIRMRHPGGGVSKYRSRSIQNTIDSMSSGNKPKLIAEGHYHKSYY